MTRKGSGVRLPYGPLEDPGRHPVPEAGSAGLLRLERRAAGHARAMAGDEDLEIDPDPDLPSSQRATEGAGFGPSEIPDPMPAALQDRRPKADESEAMDGESPTG